MRVALSHPHADAIADVEGAVTGALAGQFVPPGAFGIDYALTGMFLCLLVYQLRGRIYVTTGLLAARFVPGGVGNRTWRALAGAIAEDSELRLALARGGFMGTMAVASYPAVAAIVYLGALEVFEGELSAGAHELVLAAAPLRHREDGNLYPTSLSWSHVTTEDRRALLGAVEARVRAAERRFNPRPGMHSSRNECVPRTRSTGAR